MRFREFDRRQHVSELVPAIGQGFKAVGGAAIKATQNAISTASKTIGSTATSTGPIVSPEKSTANATVSTIPAVGSEIVLPDRDTKRPASYTIKDIKGNEVELQPVMPSNKSGEPTVSVKVKTQDLQNTITALSPNTQQGQIKK